MNSNNKNTKSFKIETRNSDISSSQLFYDTLEWNTGEPDPIIKNKLVLDIPLYVGYNKNNPLMTSDKKDSSKLFAELEKDKSKLLTFSIEDVGKLFLQIQDFKILIENKYSIVYITELAKVLNEENLMERALIRISELKKIISLYKSFINITNLNKNIILISAKEKSLKNELIEERIKLAAQLKQTKKIIKKLQGDSISYINDGALKLKSSESALNLMTLEKKSLSHLNEKLEQRIGNMVKVYGFYNKLLSLSSVVGLKKYKSALISFSLGQTLTISKINNLPLIEEGYQGRFTNTYCATIFRNGPAIFIKNLSSKNNLFINGTLQKKLDTFNLNLGDVLNINETTLIIIDINPLELIHINILTREFNVENLSSTKQDNLKKDVIEHFIRLVVQNRELQTTKSQLHSSNKLNLLLQERIVTLESLNTIYKLKFEKILNIIITLTKKLENINFINIRLIVSEIKKDIKEILKISSKNSAQS